MRLLSFVSTCIQHIERIERILKGLQRFRREEKLDFRRNFYSPFRRCPSANNRCVRWTVIVNFNLKLSQVLRSRSINFLFFFSLSTSPHRQKCQVDLDLGKVHKVIPKGDDTEYSMKIPSQSHMERRVKRGWMNEWTGPWETLVGHGGFLMYCGDICGLRG
jgi:hypothetical protein